MSDEIFALSAWIILTIPLVSGGDLLINPQNTAALSGDRILLNCKSHDGRGIYWSKCPLGESCVRIANLEDVVISDPEGKYSIQHPSAGEFNLQIDSVGVDDAMQYMCETSLSFFGERAYTEVIILEGLLNCLINEPLENLPENSTVHISCNQPFTGRWAPSIRCQFTDHATYWIYLVDTSSNTTSMFEGIVPVPLQLDGDSITCHVFFEHPKAWQNLAANEAQNFPNISSSWTSNVLNILYGPINVIITPDNSIFHVGDSVTCTATANPIPTYTWKSNGSGDIISAGQSLQFDVGHIGIWYLQCEATNEVSSSHVRRQVHICEEGLCDNESTDMTTIVGAILGTFLALSVLLNILLLIVIKRPNAIRLHCLGKEQKKDGQKKQHVSNGISSISQLTFGQQGGSMDRNSFNLHSAYQYITDDDVTTGTSMTSATSGESLAHRSPYEPVSFPNGQPSPNIQDRTLPRVPGDTVCPHEQMVTRQGGAPYRRGLAASDTNLVIGQRIVYDVPKHSYLGGTLDTSRSNRNDVFYENNSSA